MDVIEKAIRNALDKGDADDRAYREKVYRSAFAALDRALSGNPSIAADVAAKRRSDLQAKIAEIETEYIPAVPVVEAPVAPPATAPAATPQGEVPSVDADSGSSTSAPPVAPVVEAPQRPRGDMPAEPARIEPTLAGSPGEPQWEPAEPQPAAKPAAAPEPQRIEPRLAGSPAPASGTPAQERPVPESFFPDVADFGAVGTRPAELESPDAEVSAAGGPNVNMERRRPLAGIFLGVTLLALGGMGVWWGISTGLIKIPGAPDNSIIEEVPPQGDDFTPGEEEAPAKPGEVDAQRNWIQVFSPTDPSTVSAPSDAKADVTSDDSGSFVRIRSGPSGSAIVFDVPKGVLEQLAGKHAVFDIVARSEEGKESQFSVDCNFGELGDCGRKRYHAGYEKGDFLFEIDLPAKAPGAAGTIAVTSDVDNSGKAIEIFEIKASPSG